MVKYLSVCSGIEAASVAWNPLGWEAVAFSEIEKFPCAVLAHHYPHVPNWGDMTKYQEWPDADIDLLVGGTPCQSFSVAGLRKGLRDPRGNLMLTYGAIAQRYRPRWLVWENVPGVLSSDSGRDFGTFLGMLAELGYGFAYRVLDAQYVRVESHARAVPQRRRRVFVVGCIGDWRRAAAVLFERESLQRHPAPRREAGEGLTRGAEIGPSGGRCTDVSPTLDARCKDGPIRNQIAPLAHTWPANGSPTLDSYYGDKMGLEDQHVFNQHGGKFVPVAFVHQAGGIQTTLGYNPAAGTAPTLASHQTPAVAVQEHAVSENPDNGPDGIGVRDDGAAYTLESRTQVQAVAFSESGPGWWRDGDGTTGPLRAEGENRPSRPSNIAHLGMAVRRLTPLECERLQGFPDNYTAIPKAKDGPRYKALGNSMAVNVMSWVGQRIQLVNEIEAQEAVA
jgi:DNA (cytosine-5)-methyltransferase 1